MPYETLILETPVPGVGIIRFNRPDALNAINAQVTRDLLAALDDFDHNDAIGCIVLTGSDKVFAAGADIKQMLDTSAADLMRADFTDWSGIMRVSKPIIAAVSGWALGGGCEIALACDMIYASETAKFGQPEITLGIMPGGGATQRLTRAVGKALALEMMLGNRHLSAQEALAAGLVNRVYPVTDYVNEAVNLATKIAALPRLTVRLTKDAVLKADELSLSAGLDYEKRGFYLAFGGADKTEGMSAFLEKRKPEWKGR